MIRTRVLIAAPDAGLLARYRTALGDRGFEVDTAASGIDCLSRLRQFRPDVLVLQPDLPWGQGEDVLARMHQDADVRPIPVIVLSTQAGQDDLARLAPFPVHQYERQPVPPGRLADRIQHALGGQQPSPGPHPSPAAPLVWP